MGASARSVRPQTYGVRPQSHGKPAQTPPTHSVRPAASKFNPVSQAQVNDDVNSSLVVDSGNDINKCVMNSSPLTLPQANDDVTTDEILTTAQQNVVCHDS